MASKRKVTQNDLRQMMANIKSTTDKPSTQSTVPKKFKLSSRELVLMEEEKKQKALRDQEKIRLKQEKMAKIVPNQNLQPKKSILKNSGGLTTNYIPPPSNFKSKIPSIEQSHKSSSKSDLPTDFFDVERKSVIVKGKREEADAPEEKQELPEGFFDDPKLDAKARKVQYVDQDEEEWKKFQNEMANEMATAQDILVEDRNEATAGRQLEEIEEQMEAWKRVALLEERKEAARHSIKNATSRKETKDSDSDSDIELDQLTDWRKKR